MDSLKVLKKIPPHGCCDDPRGGKGFRNSELFCREGQSLLSLLVRPPQGITLLGDKLRLASVAKEVYQNKSKLRALYFSLPGEAVRPEGNGAWYYALNRKASASLLVQYFGLSGEGAFDRATRFCGPTLNFENIYFATGYPYRVFTADEIQNITIKKKE